MACAENHKVDAETKASVKDFKKIYLFQSVRRPSRYSRI